MNCNQLTTHLTELASREPMESSLRFDCQLHLADCELCRQRLAEVESLRDALRALAARDQQHIAPEAVEQRLLLALRQQKAAAELAGSARRWRVLLLRVAALLIAIGATTIALWRSPSNLTGEIASATPDAPRSGPDSAIVNSAGAPALNRPPDSLTGGSITRASNRRRDVDPPKPLPAAPPTDSDAAVETEEALTDYMLLNSGQRYYPLERGQLIRVVIPGSSLGSFGFPVNPEWAMLPVKADLVVGEDGMARAIRFIK